MKSKTYLHSVTSLAPLSALVVTGCGKNGEGSTTDISETGQQIGDAMASVDESGGNSGSLAMLESTRRVYARLSPSDIRDSWIQSMLIPGELAEKQPARSAHAGRRVRL